MYKAIDLAHRAHLCIRARDILSAESSVHGNVSHTSHTNNIVPRSCPKILSLSQHKNGAVFFSDNQTHALKGAIVGILTCSFILSYDNRYWSCCVFALAFTCFFVAFGILGGGHTFWWLDITINSLQYNMLYRILSYRIRSHGA